MPAIVFHSDKDGGQDSDKQLDIFLHCLAGGSISIDLNLSQKLHSLFTGWCLHLESSEVTEVVLKNEDEEAWDNIPNQVSQGHSLALMHAQLVILTRPLNRPIIKLVYLASMQSV